MVGFKGRTTVGVCAGKYLGGSETSNAAEMTPSNRSHSRELMEWEQKAIWEERYEREAGTDQARELERENKRTSVMRGVLKGVVLAAGDVTAACAELLTAGWGAPDL